ncbi:DNA polymerase zeta catalytic subunit isoform X2 [Tripterygium wilfordii]|uniref:DNA polymerase zeta catalytic subunit isoform X2 n=1 Tax=Tripterygium wilfordii TaxID=458696 RepID=UPI0018F81EA3|nr:DNA polymerase zeta catalytic subunit isoform X2 [Tripterygium wilfordii]
MAADSQSDSNKIFSVRLVSIDYYMSPPIPGFDICYSRFQGGKVIEVPVIRVYGSTPAGQKTCLHIHRALPYLYVPCIEIPLDPHQEGDAYTNTISLALEKALKLKSTAGSKRQHVHGCALVRARRFYGYHPSEELFVKIYLYHPNDVSRTARLLLGGEVLDRSLQPYESHIPFILQFLVDYNLYGMGLLHVSKIKFRHPVPDAFGQRKIGPLREVMDKPVYMSADIQADSNVNMCLRSPVWISSTIPSDWMWQFSDESGAAFDQDAHCVKRQSVCQLEGDAIVDEILNQQFKIYASFTQTGSAVKMVQSLIPIWEEEYERSGVYEAAMPPDPGKPLPEDVLKSLSVGLEFEKKLLDLCSEAGGALTFFENVAKFGLAGSSINKGILVGVDNSEVALYERGMHTILNEDKDARPKFIASGENLSCGISETLYPKATDTDDLGLLRWLATSQDVEDINSDDELVIETILSPLQPATTINQVLEKANMDYESESQRECQDILDSIEDVINSGNMNNRSFHPIDHEPAQISLQEKIPQLDGSSDDLYSSPCSGSAKNSLKIDTKSEPKRPQNQELQHNFTSSTSQNKRKKLLWGSLPFSAIQETSGEIESSSFKVVGSERKESLAPTLLTENEAGKCYDVMMTKEGAYASDSKEESVLVGCSVRDLMRRKRCRRVDPAEFVSSSVKKSPLDGEQKEDNLIFPKSLDFQIMDEDQCDKMPSFTDQRVGFLDTCVPETNNPNYSKHGQLPLLCHSDSSLLVNSSHTVRNKVPLVFDSNMRNSADSMDHFKICSVRETGAAVSCSKAKDSDVHNSKSDLFDGCLLKFDANDRTSDGRINNEGVTSIEQEHELSNENPINIVATAHSTVLGKESYGDGVHGGANGVDMLGSSAYMVDMMEAKPEGLIGMTFCRKPPAPDWNNGGYEKTVVPVIDESRGGRTGGSSDEFLPFFARDDWDEEVWNKCENRYSNICQEALMGVPTHYQNDGSLLYLLTPVILPPSVDRVCRWLMHDGEGTPGEINSAPMVPSSLKVCPIGSQSSLENDGMASIGCGSKAHVMPILDKVQKGKTENVKAEMSNSHDETKTIFQKEKLVVKPLASGDYLENISQISGPDGRSKSTPLSQLGFRDPALVGAGQQLTLLSIEVQAACRGDLRPDPRFDAINVIALALLDDSDSSIQVYVLLLGNTGSQQRVLGFSEEKQLFSNFMKILGSFDPDVLMGWDIQGSSLGFLAERAACLGIGLLNSISRTPTETKIVAGDSEISQRHLLDNILNESQVSDFGLLEDAIVEDEWGRTHASGVHVGGRIVLNVWRLMRGEVKLNLYTAEAVADAVLKRKIPAIPQKVLTKWFLSGPGQARYRCIEYIIERAKLNLEIINQLEMVNRTSELARVFGIDFFSVLSRGSQYRVESMLLRLAHTQNYIAISPGNQQVASQPAMECLPLVMEPQSGFYADPVVVLDFQSLYPSMIIAYNLCFSTCLGKVEPSKENTLGVSSFSPDPHILQNLVGQILLTPNGVMYVPSKVRKGVLPRLLDEILSTRIMVKQTMKKLAHSQQVRRRIFDARQLALKLIANVTYGYTAAGFSGRMPCAELADSIVQCGRRTLEKAILLVNTNERWNAKVIYGDTDSMFVLLKGRSIKESFEIGQEIASAVTAMNPAPVTLKMEKVYRPCFLLTKKRYVGYSYESPDQVKPVFDAKGIETVRRDTCKAVSKMMEQSMRLFFEHQDISQVKTYLLRQWMRVLSGRVSLQDFVFAKEVRLGTYSTRTSSSLPPAAIVATKAMRADPRAEPRYAERVPYVVIHGEPGARLVDMVIDPLHLLALDSPYRLNDIYYINKQIIPALQRVFGLIGANLNQWFAEMPRPVRKASTKCPLFAPNPHRTRIDYYYLSKYCVLCGELVQPSAHLCHRCLQNEASATAAVVGRTSKLEREMQHLAAICRHCGGGDWLVESGVKCISLACPVFYERRKVQKELMGLSAIASDEGVYPKCMVEWF